MSTTNDDTPIDNELKAYLAGEDGVSATYRQAGAEEPPAELDRLILAAAHGAVRKNVPRKMFNVRQILPVAASFMVGVLITSMYFDQVDNLAGSTATSEVAEEQLVTRSVEQPVPVPAFAPPLAGNQESQADVPERSGAQQAGQFNQQAARAVASNLPPTLTAEQSKAASENDSALADTQSVARDAVAGANVATQQDIARGAAPAASPALAPVIADSQARTEADNPEPQSEEIQITGSRIRAEDRVDVSYRENREDWLAAILALGEDTIALTDELEDNNSLLEEEMDLFLEEYPDFDLEAELQSLQEE